MTNALRDMPSFPAMLKKTLVDGYDCLQLLVLGNVAWCVSWLVPICVMTVVGPQLGTDEAPSPAHIAVAVCIALVVAAFTVGPTTMALAALARAITTRRDPRLVDFFRGFRRFFLRGAALFGLNAAVAILWAANVFFWASSGPGGERIGQLGSFALLTVLSYAMLYWVLMQIYCPAVVVREDVGALRATRRSALLVLGNLGYSALVFVQLAVLGAVIALPLFVPVRVLVGVAVMLAAFLVVAFAMLLGATALDDLMKQYEEDESQGVLGT
ncbi:MAG: hypothetical protein ACE5JM_11555 [Armatimonadota bacterium]